MADHKHFVLRIFTPAGLVLETETEAVKVPAIDGEIGVLPQHTKYSGLLGQGVLEYTAASGAVQKVAIQGGLCQFSKNTLTILADAVQGELPASGG
jgi:F-type H+-transporting ATPase subunit epsilon